MSKSLGNCIYLSDEPEEIEKKVMSMYTDPTHIKITDPGHIEGNVVFTYLDAFCKSDDFSKYLPEYQNLDDLKKHYQQGGVGDRVIKKFLNSILQAELAPIRERRKKYEKNIDEVYRMLEDGSRKAREIAKETMKEFKEAMRICYFSDKELISHQKEKYNKD